MANYTEGISAHHGVNREIPAQIDLLKMASDIWRGIRAWWWVPFLLAVTAGAIRYGTIDRSYIPYYQTSATVYVRMASDDNSYRNELSAQQMVTVFPYLLENGVLTDAIKTELETDEIAGEIALSANASTNLLTFQVTGKDPKEIHEILEAVIKVFPDTLAYIVGTTEFVVFRDMGVPMEPANSKPTWKTYMKSSIKVALAAFAAGLILAGLYGISIQTISSAEELKQHLNAPNLGGLHSVRLKKRSNKQRNCLTIENPQISFEFGESLRSVRTRFERIAEEAGGRTVLVTSAVPGEGKTTVAVNLALSLAQKGCKVLLIDGDMHKTNVADVLQSDFSDGGLHEVLEGELTVREAITFLPDSGLYVMPAGRATAKSTDLIASSAMEKLLEEVYDYADYIIIDTPPVAVLSDAIVLGKYADGFLYVVRRDRARLHTVLEGFAQIAESKCRPYGTVLNDEISSSIGYGNYYGKYGRYGKYGSYGKYGGYGSHGKKEV